MDPNLSKSKIDQSSISPKSSENIEWDQAPVFKRVMQKAIQHAVAKVDFEDSFPTIPAVRSANPFLPPPIPGLPATSYAVRRSSASITASAPSATSNTKVSAMPAAPKAVAPPKIEGHRALRREVRQPLKRRIVSSRPEELESEEELDTDFEVEIQQGSDSEDGDNSDDDDDDDEGDGDVHEDQSRRSQASGRFSPMSDFTTPPESPEFDNDHGEYASSNRAGRTNDSTSLGIEEVALADLVRATAPSHHPMVSVRRIEEGSTVAATMSKRFMEKVPGPTKPATPKKAVVKASKDAVKGKPAKTVNPKAKQPAIDHKPVEMMLCGYPKPSDPSQTCGIYTGGEVEQRRHRMKHLYLERLHQQAGSDLPMLCGGYEATFASCRKCGKLFSRGFAADRHARERNPCHQMSLEEWTDPFKRHQRLLAEIEKAEKWMHYIPSPVPRPRTATVIRSSTNHRIAEILEVAESYDDRYDIVACKNGTDYEVRFFLPGEPGGTRWFQSLGRRAYVKGELRQQGRAAGTVASTSSSPIVQPAQFREYSREHTVEGGTVRGGRTSQGGSKKARTTVRYAVADRGKGSDMEVDDE